MSETPFRKIAELHQQIHQDDPLPESQEEIQAALVKSDLQLSLQRLALAGVDISLIELALFYQWLRFTTWNHELPESMFELWSRQMDRVMVPLIQMLENLAVTLKDAGPSEPMREIGVLVQHMKDAATAMKRNTLAPHQVERQADMANRELFRLMGEWQQKRVYSTIIESLVCYFWLRTSTISANVPEEFFQKLERNWPEVMDNVSRLVKRLAQ